MLYLLSQPTVLLAVNDSSCEGMACWAQPLLLIVGGEYGETLFSLQTIASKRKKEEGGGERIEVLTFL